MSPRRILLEFLLDSLVALALFAVASFGTGFLFVEVLPKSWMWLSATAFYFAASPIYFYARWRGHTSFYNSDLFVFLPAPLGLGLLIQQPADMLLVPLVAPFLLLWLTKFREWLHKPQDKPTT